MSGISRLVAGDNPGLTRCYGAIDIISGPPVDLAEIRLAGLQREAGQFRCVAQQIVVRIAHIVDYDMVLIGVLCPEVVRPGNFLLVGCVIDLFAEVPVERQVMAEPRDQLAIVKFALRPQITFVEQQFVFGFHRFKMKVHAELGAVLEDDFPLSQAGDVQTQTLVVGGIRKDVPVIAFDIQGQEREDVHSLRRQVVHGSDDAFALAALPGRIATLEVLDMRAPVLNVFILMAIHLEIAVEFFIGQEVLRGIGAAFQEILSGLGKAQMMLAYILEQAFCSKVPTGLIRRSDVERAGPAVHETCALAGMFPFTNGNVSSLPERNAVFPGAGGIGREMDAPLIAVISAGVGRITIGRKITRHAIGLAAPLVCKCDIQTVVEKRVGIGRLARLGSIERQRNLVPFFEFPADLSG